MKICWFNDWRLGTIREGRLLDVTAALSVLPRATYPAPSGDLLIANLDSVIDAIDRYVDDAKEVDFADVEFLSPVANPSKIIGVPVNYLKHVEEADANVAIFTARYQGGIEEQGLFLKATSALAGFGTGLKLRFPERTNHHEMELGVIIGKKVNCIDEDQALNSIAGYTIALDFVVRGPEDRSFRKSIDTYAIVGPWMVTADEIEDPQNLEFELRVNGELRQRSNTRAMIMKIARQISWASQFYTLWPGDIFMTGTCEGVGPVVPGDVVDCEIEKVGAGRLFVSAAV
jgi:2,4-diketo-3-deoxy-L-fuconate hydrolase